MMRSLLATAALLCLTVGVAQGNYIILKINMAVPPPEIVLPKVRPNQFYPGIGFMPYRPIQPAKPGLLAPPPKIATNPNTTVEVFLEYSRGSLKRNLDLPAGTNIYRLDHKWGHSWLIHDGKFVQIAPSVDRPIVRPTVLDQYKNRRKDLIGKDKSAEKLLEVADFALAHGLIKECTEVMDDLSKMGDKAPTVTAAVKAFAQVREDLAKPISRDDAAVSWKDTMPNKYKLFRSEHYCLLHDETATNSEVKSRLNRLERNLTAFYYWFALRGKVLPMPERRLVALLVDKKPDFQATYDACGMPWLVADGFYARRDNLAVMSANRLDPASEAFNRYCSELTQLGWELPKLMDPKYRPPPEKRLVPQQLAHVHTIALVKKVLDEESEIATASHLGSRQLLAAVNLLPHNVEIPQWIQFGWASFFETPKFDPHTHTGAFWPGTGAPSWTYLVQFKLWEEEKKLDEPLQALLSVLTDQYFRQAQIGEPGALQKGRTYSWALAYYLSQRQLDGLIRYGQELAQLPRDLELDGAVLLGRFARAFDPEFKLVDAKQPNGINMASMETLARDWFDYTKRIPLQMPQLLEEAQKVIREQKKMTRK